MNQIMYSQSHHRSRPCVRRAAWGAAAIVALAAFAASAQVATQLTKDVYVNGVKNPTTVKTGDQLNYVITPTLPSGSAEPTAAVALRDTMVGNQSYLPGTIHTPLQWTAVAPDPAAITFNNQLVATWNPPAVPTTSGATAVSVYGSNAFQAKVPVNGSATEIKVSGTGDGYKPFVFTLPNGHLAVMTINHHTPNAGILCADIDIGGVSCIGDATTGSIFTSFAWDFVKVGNKIFYPNSGTDGITPAIGCIDVSTNTTRLCTTAITLFPTTGTGNNTIPTHHLTGVVYVAGKVCIAWATIENVLRIGCIDPATQSIVSNERLSTPGALATELATGPSNFVSLGGDKWVIGYLNPLDVFTGSRYLCMKSNPGAAATTNCDGTALAGQAITGATQGLYPVGVPRTDGGGNVIGFCMGLRGFASGQCYDTNGAATGAIPSNLSLIMPGFSSWYDVLEGTPYLMTYYFSGLNQQMTCYNWSTQAPCATAGLSADGQTYGSDWLRRTPGGGCLVTYGHLSIWELWAVRGPNGTIVESTPTALQPECIFNSTPPLEVIIPDPTVNVCGPSVNITAWSNVSLTDLPIQSGSTLEFVDVSSGAVIASAAVPATTTAPGSASVAVPAAVSFATYKTFRLRLILQNVNTPTAVTPTIKVSYQTSDSSTPQICFNAQVSSCSVTPLDNNAVLSGGGSGSASVLGTAGLTCTTSADLGITKTNTFASGPSDLPSDTVTSGTTTEYTVVITNNGPDAVNGAVVRDPAPAAPLNCPAGNPVTCTGAACPASPLTVGQLQAAGGLVLGNLPAAAGSNTVTLKFNCNVQ